MRIAVFFDLPDGGARYALFKILEILSKQHTIDVYTYKQHSSLTNYAKVCNRVYQYNLFDFANLNKHIARIASDIYSIALIPHKEKQIAKVINDLKYDFVIVNHTRHYQAPPILRYLHGMIIFLCQEPTRAFFEEDLQPDRNLPWYNRIYERVVRYFKKNIEIANAQHPSIVIANSKFSQSQIKKAYGVKSHKVLMGVDTNEFYPLKTPKLNEVLVVGNDEPQKNLRLAIDTIAESPSSSRPILHIITPRSSTLPLLQQYAKEQNVEMRVSSRINTKLLRQFYSQAICTLAVARREPFGLSVLESMACGTPVVAIDEGGFHETIVHGVTGYLTEANYIQLAEYIFQVKKINSQNCINHVKNNFSWQNTTNGMLKLLS